jgi:protein TonB
VRDPDPPKVETSKVNKVDPDSLETKTDKKPSARQVQVSDKIVKLSRDRKTTSKPTNDSAANNQQSQQVTTALRNIRGSLSATTKVEMPEGPGGGSGVSYANYAQEVRRVYTEAVRIPPDVNDDSATVEVRVTIARNGNVISSSIVKPSGSPQADRAIQGTLDRVNFVAPFPTGAKEAQRTFIISFELKAKKLLG